MFFFLNYSRSSDEPVRYGETAPETTTGDRFLSVQTGRQRLKVLPAPDEGELLLLGDPVFSKEMPPPTDLFRADGLPDKQVLYEEIRGHYYWFLIRRESIHCGSSFGAIYPLYYHLAPGQVCVSSSSFFLAQQTQAPDRDRRNLLERLLFNYPFFHSTWWKSVSLLPAHQHLTLRGRAAGLEKDFQIEDYFGEPEETSADYLDYLSSVFAEETRLFLPPDPFAVSLTGGFDGRTLVGAARQAGRQFPVYCYGRADSPDFAFSKRLARKLNIPFEGIELDEAYLQKEALPAARSFMLRSEYNGNLGRPHYDYAARRLSRQAPFILTGNFGSELFRAMHTPGVMLSRNLIELFDAQDESWKDTLARNTRSWASDALEEELEALLADLEQYRNRTRGLDPNRRFYYFVYEEMFRKYFGPELVTQSHYLNNRTPYLNLRLIRELNRSRWAGVHSRLFEKNLYKRRKGQIFYATFLRKADPLLYRLPTNKGYSPADVLEYRRLPRLLKGVVFHKYLQPPEQDGQAVEAFFTRRHRQFYEDLRQPATTPFLNALLDRSLTEIPRGEHTAKWIKLYSIAMGWKAAQTATESLSSSLP